MVKVTLKHSSLKPARRLSQETTYRKFFRFALNLKYLSSAAYRAVGQFLALPSKRTLRDYTHCIKFSAGMKSSIVHRLKDDINFEKCTPSEQKVSLIINEVKVKSGLVFTKSTGQLVGFIDLGKVNEELDQLAVSFNEGEQQSSEPKQMLVLMVWTIFIYISCLSIPD